MKTTLRPILGGRIGHLALVWAALVAGCAAPPVPEWRLQARLAVEQASAAQLTGRTRVAQQHWQTAVRSAAASGQADALARVALARCALDQAALAWDGCLPAQPYLPDAGAAERAYAAYLALQPLDAAQRAALPPVHQALAAALAGGAVGGAAGGADTPLTPLLAAIDDPLARLVGGGVAWRAGRLDAAGVALLVDTASAQGWRVPLAMWLGVQARLAEAAGDTETARRAQRRLAWVLGAAAPAQPAADPR
ncbi:hypothetical protein Tther_00160 [Tepidimonas thermarum]|uniref:Lipoprotein n=1 Tax=Tepidimonas thermarum TaxID=335431 RepID=A0A554X976_9BURK|nr:hypothetical protein [Tepidimonas thermarum]TSE32373.1 hypothetical protein Tther_00160 [Tepidimonas thermarum]